ncbi:MAG: DNA/RNA non-specific endonuclease [Meiothermus sp.]|nr:DNA/RNA non-specific endonuclease [Meiothermus sp.]
MPAHLPASSSLSSHLRAALLLLLALLAACSPASPPNPLTEGVCGASFAYGRPAHALPETQFLCRKGYAVLHDNGRKVPLYSAQQLRAEALDGSVARTDDFRPDPELLEGQRAELGDYRNSGYDRGHMAPAGDFSTDPQAMSESFLLSNMVPQNGTMNSGIWAGLESATRACARSVGAIYVLTGPVFEGTPRAIGTNQVAVPSHLYKIILEAQGGDSRAYLMPNTALPAQGGGFTQYRVSIDEVERRTGLDFFPGGQVLEDGLGTLCKNTFGT